jgi:hypothetical protein
LGTDKFTSSPRVVGGIVELLQWRRWAERNAGRCLVADLMDGAEIYGIKLDQMGKSYRYV